MYTEVAFPLTINRTFTYFVPKEFECLAIEGTLIQAKFNKKICYGYIVSTSKTSKYKGEILSILSVENQKIPPELWNTLKWMEHYYITPLNKIIRVGLSSAFKSLQVTEKKVKHILIKNNLDGNNIQQIKSLTPSQKKVIDYLLGRPDSPVPLSQFKQLIKSIYAVKNQLLKKKLIKEMEISIDNKGNINNKVHHTDKIKLSTNQNKLFLEMVKGSKYKPGLLFGVPGSGKTEIYIKLVKKYFQQGKSCLVLIPEIALTSQIHSRFKKYFSHNIFSWHSKMSISDKYKIWKLINSNEPYIIIGTRSSIFLPLFNLGLIIIDEEQDGSYKEHESQPSYNARDLGVVRAKYANCKIILGSATPSIESYYNTLIGKYNIFKLKERFGDSINPEIKIVNMAEKNNLYNDNHLISNELLSNMKQTLKQNKQILLLQNRRGYSSICLCKNCNNSIKCDRCSISLTYHKNLQSLICHHCSSHFPLVTICPYCNSENILYLGHGTQKIKALISSLFPNINILRMDTDSTSSPTKQKKIFSLFKSGAAQILLGTQMIAKGLDFENVTLVGIINADLGLMIPDFRSDEKMFQLIYQVIGRSGRRSTQGKAIIQTHNPDNKIIQLATCSDVDGFYNLQLNNRKDLYYPPFCRLIRIVSKNINKKLCQTNIEQVYSKLENKYSSIITKPMPAPIDRINKYWRYHIIIKCPNTLISDFLIDMNQIKNNYFNQKYQKSSNLFIDVDCFNIL